MGEGEFRTGWPIVLAATLGVGLGLAPMPFYTVGAFAPHLALAFGWGQADILVGFTVMTLAVVACAPLAGLLADRVGARPVALASTAMFGVSFMAFAATDGSLPRFYVNWAVMAVAGAGSLPVTWTRVVSAHFVRRRGLALGLTMTGTGVFGFLVKPFAALLIAQLGWRGAYAAIGALPILVVLPVAWWGLPRTRPLGADGFGAPAPDGLSLSQALRGWRLYLLLGAVLPIAFAITGPIPNIEAILRAHGASAPAVVALASLIGLAVVAGRLAGGWLLDRLWPPGVAFAMLAVPAAGLWLLAAPGIGAAGLAAAVLLVGAAAGVEHDIIAFLVARYFGLRGYGAIYGLVFGAFSLGAGLGPAVFARAFDATGSFARPLAASAALLPAAAAGLLLLGRRPDSGRPGAVHV